MNRCCFIVGYYGSGKTQVAINLAIENKVDYLVDLDYINPYFRSRQASKILEQNHIHVISKIESESKLKVTGLISNSNMLEFTSEKKLLTGQQIISLVSDLLKIPIILTTYMKQILPKFDFSDNKTMAMEHYLKNN